MPIKAETYPIVRFLPLKASMNVLYFASESSKNCKLFTFYTQKIVICHKTM